MAGSCNKASNAARRAMAARPLRAGRNRRGFVLLLVLLVLVISAAVLAAAVRQGGQASLDASGLQRDLQVHWGALSCQAAMMPVADEMLDSPDDPERPPTGESRHTIVLGGMKFHMVFGDELAKANVNTLAQRDATGLESAIRRLAAGDRQALPVSLKPTTRPADAAPPESPIVGGVRVVLGGESTSPYASFEQVFVLEHPSQLVGPAEQDGSVVRRRVTFWGDGKVNFRTAEMPVLQEMLGSFLEPGQLTGLERLRRSNPDFTMSELSAALRLTQSQIASLTEKGAANSDCFSLWIIAEDKARNHYFLYVHQPQPSNGEPELLTFMW